MRKATAILLAMVGGACLLSAAETPANLIKNGDFAKGTEGWTLQSDNQPNDSVLKVESGVLSIRRQKDEYFMRAFQDVETVPSAVYQLEFSIKVEGAGCGRAWVILQGKDGKWAEDKILYSDPAPAGDWRAVSFAVPTFPDTVKARINLGVNGKNTNAWVKDIRFVQVWEGRPLVTIPVLDEEVVVDGRLDEAAWGKALVLDDFRVLGEPALKAVPNSQVRLFVSKGKLHVGYVAAEPNPDSIRAKTERDSIGVYTDDCVETFISPDASPTFFHFIVNPLGFKGVEQKGSSEQNQVWYSKAQELFAGEWSAAARVGKDSWTSELSVDLKDLQLKMTGSDLIVYANFCRHRPVAEPAFSNWAGLMGVTFHAPRFFLPMKIASGAIPKKVEQIAPERLPFTKRLPLPDLLVSGKPVRLERNDDVLPVPTTLVFEESGVTLDPGVKEQIAKAVCRKDGGGGGAVTVRCSLWPEGRVPVSVSEPEAAMLDSVEAFQLTVGPQEIRIGGRTRDGVLRGLATLALMGSWAKNQPGQTLPCLAMLDAPRCEIRGWWTGGPPAEMRHLVDVLFLLRYNTLEWEISSYGKYVPFPFESHPNIADPNKPYSKADYLATADYARARGIRVVPVFYSWNRAGFILNKPEYRPLAENQLLDHSTGGSKAGHDKNFCSSNPGSYALLFDLYAEIVDTMKVTDLHIGFDETHYDDMATCPVCEKAGVKPSDWFVRIANRTHDFLKEKGVRLWICADMLDPSQNGKNLDLSGPELLKQLPHDIVLQDWKYDAGPFPSINMFAGSGFTTIGSSWQTPWNLANLIRDIHQYKAAGFAGTTWNAISPEAIPPELVTNVSLGGYLSWSPEDCDLGHFSFPPGLLYRQAALMVDTESPAVSKPVSRNLLGRWLAALMPGHDTPVAGSAKSVAVPADALTYGLDLSKALGFQERCQLDFLKEPVATSRGVALVPFQKDGQPAALMVKGGAADSAKNTRSLHIPLAGTARAVTILHTLRRQPLDLDMHGMVKEYKESVPGAYRIHYQDGSSVDIPLVFRGNINDWNDRLVPRQAEPVLFGTVGNFYQVNIPALTWLNPSPGKELKELEIIPGNRRDLDLAVLALSVD